MSFLKIALFFSIIILVSCHGFGQKIIPKSLVEQRVKEWYAAHPEQYTIQFKDMNTTAEVAGYYENTADLIRINWKGMSMEFAFRKDIKLISTHADSLQKYFNFASVDDIYIDINTPGWGMHPRTSVSSYSEGVKFIDKGNGHFAVQINWDAYCVMGYKEDEYCTKALDIMDSSMPDECYFSMRQKIDLNIDLEVAIERIKAPKQKQYPSHLTLVSSSKSELKAFAFFDKGQMLYYDSKASTKLELLDDQHKVHWTAEFSKEGRKGMEFGPTCAYRDAAGNVYAAALKKVAEGEFLPVLAKWDEKGDLQWQKEWKSASIIYSLMYDIYVSENGNVIVVGAGVYAFSEKGEQLWSYTESDLEDMAYRVLPYANNMLAVIGTSSNADCNKGICNMVRYLFDQEGRLKETKCYGGSGIENGHAATLCKDKTLIMAGHAHSEDGDVKGLQGDNNIWVVKTDKAGEIEWQKCLGSSHVARFSPFKVVTNIFEMENGDVLVVGHNTDNDIEVEDFGDVDGYVACLSKKGKLRWQQSLGTMEFDWITLADYKDGVLTLVMNGGVYQYKVILAKD